MLNPREINCGFSAARVSEALTKCAKNEPDKGVWVEEQALATGIPGNTFAGYWAGRSAPGLDNFLRLCAHLGPRFASYVLRPVGLACIKIDDHEAMACGEALKSIRVLEPVLRGTLEDMEKALEAAGESAPAHQRPHAVEGT